METLSTAGQSAQPASRALRIVTAQFDAKKRAASRTKRRLWSSGTPSGISRGCGSISLSGQPDQTKRIDSTPSAVATFDTKKPSSARSKMSRSSRSAKVGNGRFSMPFVLPAIRRFVQNSPGCATSATSRSTTAVSAISATAATDAISIVSWRINAGGKSSRSTSAPTGVTYAPMRWRGVVGDHHASMGHDVAPGISTTSWSSPPPTASRL
mmetsp:Transcript_3964/g.11215  ORF Transcript_3964/g.11215 Transcript_3964/m.11215 type:complete len:211 (-) Transcript_3964:1820-2452(-)